MHILIIPSWYPTRKNSVIGIFFQEQAIALANDGMKVGVITPVLKSLKYCLEGKYQGLEIGHEDNILTYRIHAWNWAYKVAKLRQRHWLLLGERLFKKYIENEGVPDLIHAHCALLGGTLAAKIKKNHHIPFVITEHSSEFARGLVKGYRKRLCADVFQQADARLAVSPSLAKLLLKDFSTAKKPWQWVPNLLSNRFEKDTVFFDDSVDLKKMSGQSRFRFLNIALITKNKGHFELIEAFTQAFTSDSNVELSIGGDGPLQDELIRIVHKKGRQHQIKFLGRLTREAVHKEMLATDAFVLSSHYETFGIVLIEALACGKPVIATQCGGPECIVDEDNGLLVPVKDIQSLGRAMVTMREEIYIYDSEKIRKNCLAKFSEEAVIAQLADVYQDVLQSLSTGKHSLY